MTAGIAVSAADPSECQRRNRGLTLGLTIRRGFDAVVIALGEQTFDGARNGFDQFIEDSCRGYL